METTKYIINYKDDEVKYPAEATKDSATLFFREGCKVELLRDKDNYVYKSTKDGKVFTLPIQASILYDLFELITVLNIENNYRILGKLEVFKEMKE